MSSQCHKDKSVGTIGTHICPYTQENLGDLKSYHNVLRRWCHSLSHPVPSDDSWWLKPYPLVCLFVCLSVGICLSFCLSVVMCLFIYLSVSLSVVICLFVCLFIHLSLFVYLSIFICLFIYLYLIIFRDSLSFEGSRFFIKNISNYCFIYI